MMAIIVFCLLLLGGCTSALEQLKDDPSIVAVSGTWLRIGLSPSPTAGGMPLPGIELGRGVIVRAGGDREIRIKVGERAEMPTMSAAENSLRLSQEKLGGETSLDVWAGRPRTKTQNKNEVAASIP